MRNDAAEHISSQGFAMTTEQEKALRKSEEYLKNNKIMELFEVFFLNFIILTNFLKKRS